jgi:hypothetical protein
VVEFIVTGANAGGDTKTTNSSGVATFSYTAASTGVDTIDATVDNYRLTFDSTNDLFNVDGSAVSLSTFRSALSGLTLPAVGNVVDLTTNPYSATTSGASTFILTTK